MKLSFRKQTSKNTSGRQRSSGGATPSVFSYYARGTSPGGHNTGRGETSPVGPAIGRLKAYRLRMGHAPSYVAFTAIVGAVLYSCILQTTPRIVLASASGSVSREPKLYQEAVQDIWKRSIWSRTKLTISTGNIRRDILGQFNELANVQIELPLLGHRPSVILTLQPPALQLISVNGSFYVDRNGKVMVRTSDVKQNELINLPIVRDETGVSAELGKNVLSVSEATFLTKLSDQFRGETIVVQSITLPSNAANEADVRIVGLPYYIKFSFDNDPRQGVGAYLATKVKLDADHIVPAEYIDVRVDEKVFYR